ncbi:MAG: ABC transporter permease [Limisphaerales bacterium]
MLRLFPPLATVLLVGPVLAGLAGTILPAFDYLPVLGHRAAGLQAWRQLLELPGLWTSVWLSLSTGLATTILSMLLVVLLCAAWHGTKVFVALEAWLAPLLSVPHVTVALGLAFVISPSGWIMRCLSPWATGFSHPPDWRIVQDAGGLSLMFGLIAKEAPFLLLMTLAALGQADGKRGSMVARTFGYRPMMGWLKAVFPRVYPQIRLPVLAVLAYGVSVVDVAMVLAPTTPAPLAVRVVKMANDSDLNLRFIASAGALLQCVLVIVGVFCWWLVERTVRWWGIRWVTAGNRGGRESIPRWIASIAGGTLGLAVILGLLAMTVWSVATHWRFPSAIPAGVTWANWTLHASGFTGALCNTLSVAVCTAAASLVLSVGVLEFEAASGRRTMLSQGGFLYIPLVLPQVAFLFGAQVLLALSRLDGEWIALAWLHLVFVFPYVFLALSDAYRAWDERYRRTGLCLGVPPFRVLLRIKLPMLLRPIAAAGAVGFAVSVGQYLPTLFAGAGRFPTLTTEAVALSAGGDLRSVGIYALLQMALPLAAFALALAAPAWCFRHRGGMQVIR